MSNSSLKSFGLAAKRLIFILLLFFISINLSVIYLMNQELQEEFQEDRIREINLISSFVQDALNRSDSASAEQYLQDQVKASRDIIKITAVGPKGFELTETLSSKSVKNEGSMLSKSIILQEKELLRLEFTYHKPIINPYLKKPAIKFAVITALLTCLIGFTIWRTQNKLVLKPLLEEIQKRKQTEEDIKKEKEFFTTAINALDHPFYAINVQDHSVILANNAARDLNHLDLGTKCYKFSHNLTEPCEIGTCPCPMGSVILSKRPVVMEHLHHSKEGQAINIEVRAHPIFDENRNVVQIIKTDIDITQRKQAENELKKLSIAVEQSPASIVITDTQGRIEYVNPKFVKLTGYSYEEAIGQNPRVLKSGEMDPVVYEDFWKTITSGNEWHGEFHNRKKNGETYWEMATVAPLKDQEGNVTHYIAVKEDITQARRLMQEKQFSEERYRALFEQAADSILLLELEALEIKEFNETAHQSLGYTREEFHKIKISDIDIYESPKQLQTHAEKIIDQGVDYFETKHRKKNGELIDVSVNSRVISVAGKQYIQTIWRDITKHKRLEKELLQAMTKAKAANQAKSTFLASMSHELRTPLNSILGFAQILNSNNNENLSAKQLKYVNYILSSGSFLLELINDILDLSKIESGKYDLSLEPVPIKDLFIEAVDQINSLAMQYDISLTINESDLDLYILADRRSIKQILLNLLSNAIKYNRSKGTVHLFCSAIENNNIEIKITDTGKGIAPDKLDRLFEPFDRLGSENSTIEGTGIGLTITKRLVNLMNGTIKVSSQISQGTTFCLVFPETQAQANFINPVKKARERTFTFETSRKTEDYTAETVKEKKILYIEDNKANLKLVESILIYRSDLKLINTETAEEGILIAVAEQPDIILLDINLPGMDGLQALKLLKDKVELKHIPVIAVTAKAMADDIDEFKDTDFSDYITKPIDIARFKNIIDANLLN